MHCCHQSRLQSSSHHNCRHHVTSNVFICCFGLCSNKVIRFLKKPNTAISITLSIDRLLHQPVHFLTRCLCYCILKHGPRCIRRVILLRLFVTRSAVLRLSIIFELYIYTNCILFLFLFLLRMDIIIIDRNCPFTVV